MQDILRNELLDKLAAGWKVRRKSWTVKCAVFGKDWPTINISDLISNDWEGEPPGPVRMYEGCAITFAFEKLRGGAKFIRRTAWKPATNPVMTIRNHSGNSHVLAIEDILAEDWEVWG